MNVEKTLRGDLLLLLAVIVKFLLSVVHIIKVACELIYVKRYRTPLIIPLSYSTR